MNLIKALGRALLATVIVLVVLSFVFSVLFLFALAADFILSYFISDIRIKGLILFTTFISVGFFGIALKAEFNDETKQD